MKGDSNKYASQYKGVGGSGAYKMWVEWEINYIVFVTRMDTT
jgi:hypothetical protein